MRGGKCVDDLQFHDYHVVHDDIGNIPTYQLVSIMHGKGSFFDDIQSFGNKFQAEGVLVDGISENRVRERGTLRKRCR